MTNEPSPNLPERPPDRDLKPDQIYWRLWQQGSRPDLSTFLGDHPEMSSLDVASVLVVDQYERWTLGERIAAETYLQLLPTGADHDRAACDVVYSEFLLRKQLGEHPDPQEFLLRYPAIAPLLRRQFDLHAALAGDTAAQPENPPPTILAQSLTVPTPSATPLIPGYQILEKIGQGGMGIVYKARQMSLNRIVALKVVTPPRGADPVLFDRLRREAEVTARLTHPNIVTVFDAGLTASSFYLAMEYVSGIDLHHLVEKRGPLPIETACSYLLQAARGLQHAHEQGLIHRDIKPSNFIVTSTDEMVPGKLKILDLGLARVLASSSLETEKAPITQVGAFMGTPDFIAPEQAKDPRIADVRSDLYSLGCSMFYLLSGRPPFLADSPLAKIVQHHLQEPTPIEQLRPDIPPVIAAILRRLMAKDPLQRFQSAGELVEAVTNRTLPSVPPAPATSPPAFSPPPPTRVRLAARFAQLHDRLRAVAFSPDGARLVVGGDDGLIRMWELKGEIGAATVLPVERCIAALAFLPTGQTLICAADEVVSAWEVATCRLRWKNSELRHIVSSLTIDPSGRYLVCGDKEGKLHQLDAESGTILRTWNAHSGAILGVALVPQLGAVLSGGNDRSLHLYDVTRGESLALFPEQPMQVTALAVSPFGDRALTGGIDGIIHVWDTHSRREIAVLKDHEARITSLAFSPDGRRAVSASRDRSVRLWNLTTYEPLEVIREHTDRVVSVAWHPLGLQVASASHDRSVCIWNVEA